jgi:hypothetical protein
MEEPQYADDYAEAGIDLTNIVEAKMEQDAMKNSLTQIVPDDDQSYGSSTMYSPGFQRANNGKMTLAIDGTGQDVSMYDSHLMVDLDFTKLVQAIYNKSIADIKVPANLTKWGNWARVKYDPTTGLVDQVDKYGGVGYMTVSPFLFEAPSQITAANIKEWKGLLPQTKHLLVPVNQAYSCCFSNISVVAGTNNQETFAKHDFTMRMENLFKRIGHIPEATRGPEIGNKFYPTHVMNDSELNEVFKHYNQIVDGDQTSTAYGYSPIVTDQNGGLYYRLSWLQPIIRVRIPLSHILDFFQMDNILNRFPLTITLTEQVLGSLITFGETHQGTGTDVPVPETADGQLTAQATLNDFRAAMRTSTKDYSHNKITKVYVPSNIDADLKVAKGHFADAGILNFLKGNVPTTVQLQVRLRNPQDTTFKIQEDQLADGPNETWSCRIYQTKWFATPPYTQTGQYTFGPTGQNAGGVSTITADNMFLFPLDVGTPSFGSDKWNFSTWAAFGEYMKYYDPLLKIPIPPTKTMGQIKSLNIQVTNTPGNYGVTQNRTETIVPRETTVDPTYSQQFNEFLASPENRAAALYQENLYRMIGKMRILELPATRVDGYLSRPCINYNPASLQPFKHMFLFPLSYDGSLQDKGGRGNQKIRAPSGVLFTAQLDFSVATNPLFFMVGHISSATLAMTSSGSIIISNSNESL